MSFFYKKFEEERNNQDFTMLEHIPRLVTREENEEMIKLPSQQEIKKVFSN